MRNGLNRLGSCPDVHRDPEVGDHPGQQCAPGLVDLLSHQSRHHLDDVRLQSELAQRVRGFQPQQAATDHHARRGVTGPQRALGVGTDGVEVVKRAVDVARGQVMAGHRRDESVRPGGQHQGVVAVPTAVRGDHRLCCTVDLDGPRTQQQLDAVVARVVIAGQCQQVAVPALGVGGQPDPVVGRVGLLGQHGDSPGVGAVPRPKRLNQPVAHHAVPDHDDVTGNTVCARGFG